MNKTMLIITAILVIFGIVLALSSRNTKVSLQSANSDILTPSPTPAINIITPVPPTAVKTIVSPMVATAGESSPSSDMRLASKAIIKTSKGDIVLDLYVKDAPKTVENFIRKAGSGFYDSLTFHRVENWVIQGGDPNGNGTGGGTMPTELNNKPFVAGSLGVARGGDINVSNDSQFFITKTNAEWLNGQYTNFGIITSGMDVVDSIAIGDKILQITVQP